jgi:hypothetical protein
MTLNENSFLLSSLKSLDTKQFGMCYRLERDAIARFQLKRIPLLMLNRLENGIFSCTLLLRSCSSKSLKKVEIHIKSSFLITNNPHLETREESEQRFIYEILEKPFNFD